MATKIKRDYSLSGGFAGAIALDNDLTAGGVKSIKGVAEKASKKMASLHEDVSALMGKISDTRKLLGSSAEY